MATIEIIVGIEKEFALQIPDEDLSVDLFDSVRTMADYVRSSLEEANPQDERPSNGT